MIIESFIPRITNYRTIRKTRYFSSNKIKGNTSETKNNETEKNNMWKKNSLNQFSYINKKGNKTVKSNRNKPYCFDIPNIKKRFKSKTKRISINDKSDDFTYNYNIKDIYKSI